MYFICSERWNQASGFTHWACFSHHDNRNRKQHQMMRLLITLWVIHILSKLVGGSCKTGKGETFEKSGGKMLHKR